MEPGTAIRRRAALCRKAALDAAKSDAPGDIIDAALRLEKLFPIQERDFGPECTARAAIVRVSRKEAEKHGGSKEHRLRIVVSDRVTGPDRLVAIAHEIGHYHLHRDECHRDGFRLDSRTKGYSPRQVKEIQANLFADEFLCPSHELRALLATKSSLDAIASDFGLPPDLIRRQAVQALLRPPTGILARPGKVRRQDLSAAQNACVAERDRPLLALGGPGCGKTTTLANRVLSLVSGGAKPASVMVLAATRAAADAMHAALAEEDPRFAGEAWFGTVDDLAFEIIVRFPSKVGLTDGFNVLDKVGQTAALRKVVDGAGLPAKECWELRRSFDAARLEADHPPEFISCRLPDVLPAPAAADYQTLLETQDTVDWAGLVPRALGILRGANSVAFSYQQRFEHLLIDDLHEMPASSIRLLQRIFFKGKQVFATGDPSQAIEQFRGRSAGAVGAFGRLYGAETIRLDLNHRSAEPIAAAVAALGRDASPRRACGAAVDARLTLDVAPDVETEADLVARRVLALRGVNVRFADQAVLAWSHRTLKTVALALRAKGVPIKFLGDLNDRPEKSAVLDIVRSLVRSDEKASMADRLTDRLFAGDGYLAPILRAEDSADSRVSLLAVHHLLNVCQQHEVLGGDLKDLEKRIEQAGSYGQRTQFRDLAVDALDLDAVTVTTIHSARGKEFPVVHLPGLHKVNGRAPLPGNDETGVLRVAFSRARERLHLSRAIENGRRACLPALPDLARLPAMPTSLALLRR